MNFIGEYQLEDTTVCDNLIEYFEKSDRQHPGWMGYRTFNTDLKDSCLLYTSPSPRDGLLSRMPSSA